MTTRTDNPAYTCPMPRRPCDYRLKRTCCRSDFDTRHPKQCPADSAPLDGASRITTPVYGRPA